MNAIPFKQVNVIYKAEGCGDLPTYKSECEIVSCWEPDDEEMEYIKKCINNNEKPKFYLDILGQNQPPVYVGCNLFEEAE